MSKIKYQNFIPIIKDKSPEEIEKYYQEIIPFTLIDYPVYKLAELFGIKSNDQNILVDVRYALWQVKESNANILPEEDFNTLINNIKKMKNYFTKVDLINTKIGTFNKETNESEMINLTTNQKKAALLHLYQQGDYICQTLYIKTLRQIAITKELDVEQILNNANNLTKHDFKTIENRINNIGIFKTIPSIDNVNNTPFKNLSEEDLTTRTNYYITDSQELKRYIINKKSIEKRGRRR